MQADVCIIGAGLAGVTAAQRLTASNCTCVILEAADRVGGRLRSADFAGRRVEEGANWVQGLSDQNPIWERATKLRLAGRREFEAGTSSHIAVRCVRQDRSSDAAKSFEAFDAALEAVEGDEESDRFPEADIDVATALAKAGWASETPVDMAVEYFRHDFEYGEAPAATSVHHNVHEEFLEDDFGEGGYFVDDPRGFAAICGGVPAGVACQLNSTVASIQYSGHSGPPAEGAPCAAGPQADRALVRVRCQDGREVVARAVLCTVSAGVLNAGHIRFEPPLPPEKVRALGSIRMCNYTKVFLEFEEPFWTNEAYILHAGAHRGRYVVWQPLAQSSVIMVTATGDEGRRIELLTDEEVLRESIQALEEMYADPPRPVGIRVCRWTSDPRFLGAYSFLPTGALPDGFDVLARPVGPLFFAGEAFHARYSGYLQGALLSGEEAAHTIVAFLGAAGGVTGRCGREAPCAVSPRGAPSTEYWY